MGTYVDEVCSRCGSKKRIVKKRREKLETYSGTSMLEISQVICTNKVCQAKFEKDLAEETERRNKIKQDKEEANLARRANIIKSISETRKAKQKAA